MTIISLIVAVADNGVIGNNNALPWTLKEDMRRFKALTTGKPVIMGRKTFESIGRPLPRRPNIVISRQPDFRPEGVRVCSSLSEAIRKAEPLAGPDGEIMVIGGSQIYTEALPQAQRIYLTEVHARPGGDVFFAIPDRGRWTESSREDHRAGEGETADCSFVVLERG
ncbi:MAG: dihydrofolate reductase [Pseudomonadota bacterium]|nr:dihydrofolate reductase [Pseudomonadota bacterium]